LLEGTSGSEQTNLTSRQKGSGKLALESGQADQIYFDDSYNFDQSSTATAENPNGKQLQERVIKMGQPHAVMQDRLNSMNPLMFGDTIRLPFM